MIEILHEYWKPLLWTDGYRFTGGDHPVTLILSVIGGVLALFRRLVAPSNKYIQFPTGYLLIFSRYAAVCSVAGVLFRHVHAEIAGTEFLNAFFFRSGLYRAGADAYHLRLHYRFFAGAPVQCRMGN